jgi:type I restriction enzyme S subunit
MPTTGHRAISWYDRPFGSGSKFINGDVLLARITPCLENGKTAFVDFLPENAVGWGSTEYIVLRARNPIPLSYIYFLARTEAFREHAIQSMTGSSGRQRVQAEAVAHFGVPLPNGEIAMRFGGLIAPLLDMIRTNDEQSRTLAQTRDLLLPKLLSGEVRLISCQESLL